MRKWTKSACVVVALGILALLTVTGSGEPAHAAEAKASIASSSSSSSSSSSNSSSSRASSSGTRAAAKQAVAWIVRPGDTLSAIAAALGVRGGWQALYAANQRVIGADPDVIRPGTALTVPGTGTSLRYTVAPGDTLSGIAAALKPSGGWPALYAANRRLIGPDPGLIQPGTVLTVPAAAAGAAPTATGPGQGPGQGSGTGTGPGSRGAPSSPARGGQPPVVSGSASPAGLVPVRAPGAAPGVGGDMPRWLKATLLAVGVLAVASLIAQPAVAAGQRRRRALRARAAAGRDRGRGRRAAENAARIVQADHERLIITYSLSDETVYLLTPPGEDPRAVLRAARLVVPEDTYEDLADHLGVPSGWQRE